ncbi:hypothetical protein, conserved [Leishmania donovani]|uniref:Uncharacterized protein n=1 Tax=Leishmania donovani TaxID=5661 RepID=E9BQU0_LEIDO|nr:hypothetical protein, conserved [Leishmania donovani]TPP40050.1 hypothetical protein CGC21_26020 [Leishmania donovani]CBZ37619.1 hypothetical protein, conserved [Leishmania donovani]
MWGFEAYAEGLSTTPNIHGAHLTGVAPQEGEAAPLAPPRYLWKKNRNNYLFDAQGKLLGAAEAHSPTIWRTHHAFSGRCALVNPTAPVTGGAAAQSFGAPGWAEQAWTAYQSWSVGFRLSSTTTDEPHILLSVAPAYFPNLVSATGEIRKADAATLASLPCAPSAEEEVIYNKRMLETPLIWEEPYALSVECTTHGVFLWSDHWGIFGRKIADRCLEARQDNVRQSGIATLPSPDPSPSSAAAGEELALVAYDAALRLRWNAAGPGSKSSTDGGSARAVAPTLSVELKTSGDAAAGGAAPTCEEKVGEELWQHLIDLPLSLDEVACKAAFRPYVTLMEGGDAVELL